MIDFNTKIESSIAESIATKKDLLQKCKKEILEVGLLLGNAIKSGNKILFCGNGGSAADSQHLAAELVVRLRGHINRPALPGLALTVDTSILTAGGNDIGYDNVFARGVEAFGKQGDVLIGITTSGKSPNVINAVNQAKAMGIITVGLLGGTGDKMKEICDYNVTVPSSVTARIQESHIMIGHIWCEMIEEINFPEMFS
jgi:D-sedoheptulose 7-phosphate isomerase